MLNNGEVLERFKQDLEEKILTNQLSLLIEAGQGKKICLGKKGTEILAPLLQAGWLCYVGEDKYAITNKGKEEYNSLKSFYENIINNNF